MKAKSNARLFSILHANKLNIPDGEGISLFTGIPVIKGRVLMEDLFNLLNDMKKSVYIVVSTSKVIQKSIKKMKVQYPYLNRMELKVHCLIQTGIHCFGTENSIITPS